jgi:hypothetical protein
MLIGALLVSRCAFAFCDVAGKCTRQCTAAHERQGRRKHDKKLERRHEKIPSEIESAISKSTIRNTDQEKQAKSMVNSLRRRLNYGEEFRQE